MAAHDAHLGVLQQGFTNLLVATAFALRLTASAAAPRRAEAIIGEPDPAAFALTATELGWRELEVGIETVLRARELFVAFGSFGEPIEDLLSCGILEPTPARA